MFRTVAGDRYAVTELFRLSASAFQEQSAPVFAALAGGGFIAVWNDQDGFNDPGVKARLFDSNGRGVGDEFLVNLTTSRVQTSPTVSALPGGGFVIAWSDEAAYPAVFEIKAQMFDANGGRIGEEFVVNSSSAGFQTSPSVTTLAGGGFVVTWEHAENSGFDDVRGQV